VPAVNVTFFRDEDGDVSFLRWFEELNSKVQDKCAVRLERLAQFGHELRRPEADFLRDGIYELRVGFQGTNYRILYFFHGREVVVVSHGLVKEQIVSPKEIDRAIRNKITFATNPTKYGHEEEE
jgi:phage-related protein